VHTETMSVPEIHCDNCKQSIEGALNPIEGVSSAIVDVANATVKVSYEPDRVAYEDLVRVIEEQGYEVPAQP
jgi:copper chaperone